MKLIHGLVTCGLVILAAGCAKEEREDAKGAPAEKQTATSTNAQTPPVGKQYSGPFGLAMGITQTELKNQLGFTERSEIGQDVYTGKPPKPVAGIDEVMVAATKDQGLCRLIASSEVSVVNDTGAQIRSEVDRLAEMIELKYGKHTKKYDFATQDVYERNPQFWMMALKEDAVFYSYEWKNGQSGLALPNSIKSIEVSAAAVDTDSGWARIAYTFDNYDACQSEMKKVKAENL